MTSWRDKMGPAKFRGVPFFVETAERSGGRRTVRHEYPLRDEPFSEDMGRKARTFPIDGYVVGEDYIAARDKLLEALERVGPGELIHPYHGTRRVAVANYRVSESRDHGGMARFSIEFEETPARPAQPTAVQDAVAKARASAADATTAACNEFLAKYSPGVLSGSVLGSLRSAALAVNKVLATVEMETQALAQLKQQVNDFTASVGALVNEPADLLTSQLAIFEALGAGLVSSAATALNPSAVLLGLYAYDPGKRPPATTTNRQIEQVNFDAVQRLTQRLVVIQATLLAIGHTFSSYDEAVQTRTAITVLLDAQAEVVSDDTYPTILQLRADLVKAVPGDATDLARLVSYTPPFTVPSLVLAHRLYGDLSLEADLIARNRVRNPFFVPGGIAIEVLSRG